MLKKSMFLVLLSGFVSEYIYAGPKSKKVENIKKETIVPSSSSAQRSDRQDEIDFAKNNVQGAIALYDSICSYYAISSDCGSVITMSTMEDARFFGTLTKIPTIQRLFEDSLRERDFERVIHYGRYAETTSNVVAEMYKARKKGESESDSM